jgi:DNA-binding Xre family transcriptional regulator
LTTAYQLAMRCGIKRTTAYRLWDNPQAYPTRKTMMKLCDGLGVEPGQILVIV